MNFYQLMRVMKITMVLITCFLLQVSASTYGQHLTINKKAVALSAVLEEISEKSGYDFFYDAEIFDGAPKVSVNVKNADLSKVLSLCFSGLPFDFTIRKNTVAIWKKSPPANPDKNLLPQQTGRIAGKIIDDRGEPLPGANIKVIQNGQGAQSNVDGNYIINIPTGIYTLEISYISFQIKRIAEIEVKAGKTTDLNVVLKPVTNNLDQVVVNGTFKTESINALYARQKNDAVVSNGISREQMAALPDKNIGEILKRISGVSATDNRRVVVRGIAERYNLAMMDGAILPSTDVQVRDFEFDIIPSNLVDNVVVSKTATPDMSFGFGGGLVQVNTMAIPNQDFMSFSIGSKYINGSTGKEFLGYARGKNDYFAFDDGGRDHFPKEISFFSPSNYTSGNPAFTPEKIAVQNKSIGGTERLGARIYQTAPAQNYQFSMGRSYGLKQSRFGFVGSLSYRNEQAIDDIGQFERGAFNKNGENYYDPITNAELRTSSAKQYNFTTSLGALVNLGWSNKNHKLTLRNFYSRVFANQFFNVTGWGENAGSDKNPALHEYDRPKFISLLQNRLTGEHAFGKLKLEWGVARNNVDNHEQDAIDAQLGAEESLNGTSFLYGPGNGTANPGPLSRSSYHYVETNWAADAALSYRFNIGKLGQVFKTGYQFLEKKGDFAWNVLPMVSLKGMNDIQPIHQWNFDFSDPEHDVFYLPANFNNSNYTGRNNNQAWYGMMDNRLNSWIRLVWGIRGEYYKYEKIKDSASDKVGQGEMDALVKNRYVDPETGNLVHRTRDGSAEEKKWLYLPSANLTLTPLKDLNIRASYAKSAIRPALIENSSFARYNYLYGRVQRNTGVVSTLISHYDLRMEWYPSAGEVISVGYFKKHFKNPVEMYLDITTTSGAIDLLTSNSDFANVNGWEFDLRKNLGFINNNWNFLKDFYVSGNLTLQKSEVQASSFRYLPMAASDDNEGVNYSYRTKTYLKEQRPLYGQVPLLYNIGLQYTGDRLSANVAFNHSGYKTFTVAMQPMYSEIERPRNQLDAQVGYKFLKNKKMGARLNMANLLNSPYRFFINSKNTYRLKPGATNVDMTEWSDLYEWKEGFSNKYEKGSIETNADGKQQRIGDTDTFFRKVGTSFGLSLTYNL